MGVLNNNKYLFFAMKIIERMAIAMMTLVVIVIPTVSQKKAEEPSLPIIYSSKYNVSVLGEDFHQFNTKKFKQMVDYLTTQCGIRKSQLITPSKITQKELLKVHKPEYLKSLNESRNIAQVLEMPSLRFIPITSLKSGLLEPMLFGAGGTVLGVKKAIESGWAINLSGGYHHAKRDHGEGFCFFADIPIAVKCLWEEKPHSKVLIVDLDAHQGNGVSSILGDDNRIAILDIYNSHVFPDDENAERFVSYNIPITRQTDTRTYLGLIDKWLPLAIKEHKPDLIIYNAGTDIFILDALGGLSITEQGIIKRDEKVFKAAVDNSIPILMLLAGGYHKKSGEIIGKSIENLLNTVLKGKI